MKKVVKISSKLYRIYNQHGNYKDVWLENGKWDDGLSQDEIELIKTEIQ